VKETARKWYKKLGLPEVCDKEFEEILECADIEGIDKENPVQYLVEQKDLGLNLVYILAKCEEMQAAYADRGIPDKYLRASLTEIMKEVLGCRESFGMLGIYELVWFDCVVKGTMLFRIGRLNFMMETAGDWCAGGEVHIGDKMVSVHIPGGEKLDDLACYQAFAEAERFIMRYFPEHDFKYFMCHSWLLDELYEDFLTKDSNISKFRKMFKTYRRDESDDAIKFVFDKGVTRENIGTYLCKNSFQEKMQKYIMEGGRLYVTCGTRARAHEDILGIDCHYHQMQWFADDMSGYPENYKPECEDTGDLIRAAEEYMESNFLQGLNILCMPNMEDLFQARDITQNILGAIVKCENSRVYAYGAMIYPEFPIKGDCDFCGQAKRLIEMGFDGIKLIETKPNAHKKVGLPVCDEAYEAFWSYVEQEEIPVLCHVNDPVYCWNEKIMPKGSCFTEQFAHYETIYDQVLQVLEKHSRLKITFAHFLFLGYDTERLAGIMDRYPNVCIDITPAEEEYGYLSELPEKARAFFIKYSDRILLGSDNKNAFKNSFKNKKMSLISRFLRTDDRFKGFVYEMQGIALDRPQLENILYQNFRRIVGETPKPVNKTALRKYIEELLPQLPAGRTGEQIRKYLEEKL